MTKSNPLYRAAAPAAAATGACLLALACPGVAAASGSGTAEGRGEKTPLNLGSSAGSTHSSGSGASLVRTIVGLAIVIAVIWGLSWILRQVKSRRDPSAPSTGLASIAALQLSSGRAVHLVRAGSDYLLLGSAEHGVMPIHRYSEEEAREAGLLDVLDVQPRPRRALLRPPSAGSGSSAGLLGPQRSGGASGSGSAGGAGVSGGAGGPGRSGRASGSESEPGHDPMSMPSPGPGSSLLDKLRELTVRR
jgi:flagellar protein FliO/FliZ